ncbi:MAG: T9SS type A sorting domain-containing protein, partial [Bacteroidia bacterium]
ITINVHPLPVVTFDTLGFADSVCLNAGIQTFAGASPAGGIYSGPGVSGVTFDPVAAGLGAHIITYTYSDSNSCSNTSTHDVIVVSCGTTSVQQNNNDNANLIIYPNPNSGTITVSFKNRLDVIHIYNTIGELVYQTRSDNVKETIDISALNSGVYTLEVQGNYVKIIKQ